MMDRRVKVSHNTAHGSVWIKHEIFERQAYRAWLYLALRLLATFNAHSRIGQCF